MEYDSPPITTCSFSRLDRFEKCPYLAALEYAEKIEQPTDSKREEAFARGKKIHDDAEQYVKGELDQLPKDLKKFEGTLNDRRERYAERPDNFVIEEDWAFTIDWQPTGWFDDNVWLRCKLDVGEWLDDERSTMDIIDYKSGKKEGNEVKHGQQGQLYVITAFMKYDTLQQASAWFEYTDHGKTSMKKTYSREQAMMFLPRFEDRLKALTSATHFPPRPNIRNCAYCPYGPKRGNGHCIYGVEQ